MQQKNGTGTGETSNAWRSASRDDDRTEHRWKRLFEAVELLESSAAATSADSERGPRLQAVVIEMGPPSPRALRKLQAFRAHFPHVAIMTPRPDGADAEDKNLDGIVAAFASSRGLSPRQRKILELHLSGKHDKEIASDLGCEQTTIYEHWRRMARKAHGSRKSDLVADFHHYLASRSGANLKNSESSESSGSIESP
jgi:DNA-binding CsgD family transcriptional regulator